ncbi:MAG: protein kinase [Thermoguttaceae bacterium]|nr:protein kinase [Thermoguttaceae bacterium]MDW8039005.1 protein kinase [Thermoguttaceae bacterium]
MSSSRLTHFAQSAPLQPGEVPLAAGTNGLQPAARLEEQPTVISQQPPWTAAELERRADRLLPGQRLEHFEILDLIGGGGMARVYRARDTRLDRIVALKVLTAQHAVEPETRQRFYNEARSAAQLDHENIARVYYVGEERGIPFIVYEYIHGINLRLMVEQRGPLPVAEAVHYTLQVAEALSHAASRNIIHRDIKPSNILITPEGRAKLIDLGLARIHKPLSEGPDLTATGVTLGTFDYIAPEQARDPRSADVRSDIYSLGCAFFFMLVGRPPFPEGTVLQKLLQHQTEQPPDPRIWRPELPESLIRILRKMLAKDPADRYQDPQELVADLLALAELVGSLPNARTRTVWITPRPRLLSYLERHLPWLIPLAALLAAVMVLDWLWSSGASPELVPSGLPSGHGWTSQTSPLPSGPLPTKPRLPSPLNPSETSSAGSVSGPYNPSGRPTPTGPSEQNAAGSSSPTGAGPKKPPQPPNIPPSSDSAESDVDNALEPERFQGKLSPAESFEGELRSEKIPPQ